MRNERGDLLYIGKAARLRDRVASYFNGGAARNAKTAELVGHLRNRHAGASVVDGTGCPRGKNLLLWFTHPDGSPDTSRTETPYIF